MLPFLSNAAMMNILQTFQIQFVCNICLDHCYPPLHLSPAERSRLKMTVKDSP